MRIPNLERIVSPILENARKRAGATNFKWEETTLRTASREIIPRMKFDATLITFIDGLDECENTASRIESLRFLLDWVESAATASLTVRLCISGRPETEIDGRLTRGHVLMLQDFTKNDIYHYIHMELNHPSIVAMRDYSDYKSIKNTLISSIAVKAAAIFLWEF